MIQCARWCFLLGNLAFRLRLLRPHLWPRLFALIVTEVEKSQNSCVHINPTDYIGIMENAMHFVGFKGEEFHRAIAVFGQPDFIHRQHDGRCISMVMPDDTVVYANGAETPSASVYSFDDSSVMWMGMLLFVIWVFGWAVSSLLTFAIHSINDSNVPLNVGLARCFFWPMFIGYLVFTGAKGIFKSYN